MRNMSIALSVLLAGLGIVSATCSLQAGTLKAKVGASPDVGNWTEAKVDKVFGDATAQLNNKEVTQDIHCINMAFKRVAGSNLSDADMPSEITTKKDYQKAAKHGYKMNFVNAIRVCGSIEDPDIRGCRTHGRMFIVSSIPRLYNTVAHEWGHFVGLSHTPVATTNKWRIMYRWAYPERVGVKKFECKRYTGTVGAEADTPPPSKGPEEEEPSVTPVDDMRDFLLALWIHGTPVDEIMALTPEQIAVARDVIEKIEPVDMLPNAVSLMGLRGTSEDVEPLINLMQKLAGNKTASANTAIVAIPLAIGRITGRTESSRGLQFLRNTAIRSGLEDFTFGSGVSDELLRQNLIIGLAYTRALTRAQGNYNINMLENAATTGAFNLKAGSGFFEYVDRLGKSVRDLGVIEQIKRGNSGSAN